MEREVRILITSLRGKDRRELSRMLGMLCTRVSKLALGLNPAHCLLSFTQLYWGKKKPCQFIYKVCQPCCATIWAVMPTHTHIHMHYVNSLSCLF